MALMETVLALAGAILPRSSLNRTGATATLMSLRIRSPPCAGNSKRCA